MGSHFATHKTIHFGLNQWYTNSICKKGDELFTLFEPFLNIQEAPFFGESSRFRILRWNQPLRNQSSM